MAMLKMMKASSTCMSNRSLNFLMNLRLFTNKHV